MKAKFFLIIAAAALWSCTPKTLKPDNYFLEFKPGLSLNECKKILPKDAVVTFDDPYISSFEYKEGNITHNITLFFEGMPEIQGFNFAFEYPEGNSKIKERYNLIKNHITNNHGEPTHNEDEFYTSWDIIFENGDYGTYTLSIDENYLDYQFFFIVY